MTSLRNQVVRVVACWAFGLGTVVSASAQPYQPPPPPLTNAPCVPTRKVPCTPQAAAPAIPATADKFPFPTDSNTPDIPGEGTGPRGQAAANPPPSQPASSGGKAFPFPGEPQSPAAGGESSSSSSSASGEPLPDGSEGGTDREGKPSLKDAGSSGSTRFARKHLPKVEDMDHREAEDVEVSKYYLTTGNFSAAYLRAKDAINIYADDAEAHLILARAAERLKLKQEAVGEYTAYLKLEPDGPQTKTVLRALETLGAHGSQ